MPRRPTIFLSAAEASGDEHAANLLRSLRERVGAARFVGVAGPRMAAAGCEVLADLTGRAEMLLGPVLRLGYYVRTVGRLKRRIAELRPDVVVPVDSPALNWHLAAAAKRVGSPVVHYIAPQVWAWATWRVRKLSRLTDAVACILPFEQAYLRRRGVRATYVGHPIFDTQPPPPRPPDITDAWCRGTWRVALLPGSRPGELRHHARPLLAVARAIRDRWPAARCTFAAADADAADTIRSALGGGAEEVDLTVGRRSAPDVLADSHFAVAASGTVCLQAAWLGVPMVIFYRAGLLSSLLYHALGRTGILLATPHFALVNILAGRALVPELVPWRRNKRRLIDTVLEVMDDVGYLNQTRQRLLSMVRPLRAPAGTRACDNAAELVLRHLRPASPAGGGAAHG
jgi:lipid-A-disaccharide synthase